MAASVKRYEVSVSNIPFHTSQTVTRVSMTKGSEYPKVMRALRERGCDDRQTVNYIIN